MRKQLTFGFCALILVLLSQLLAAQKAKVHVLTADEAKVVKKDAGVYFNAENYNAALPGYIDLRKSAPDNVEYNYRLGICYLMTNSDKSLAIDLLEFVSNSKEPKKEVWYYLGLAKMYGLQFDAAISDLEHYKSLAGTKVPKDFLSIDMLTEQCRNGKELVSRPVDVTFVNMGKTINTVYDEYNPMISADGKQLVFTSRRKGNVGGYIEDLGMFSSDTYWSVWRDTVWTKPKGLGGMVNTDWDEECVGISPDGSQLLMYFDNAEAYADIGKSILKGKMWQRPEMMSGQLNSKNYEGGATVSLDGNTLIFSSNRKETNSGGSDLYMIKKDASGSWSDPVSLGTNINTRYDEDSPFLSLAGKTLFFASKGWNSMGGFDIFRSEWDESTSSWSKPENMGYPINDPDDNSFFSVTGDGRILYVSSCRKGGFGERDLYKVLLNSNPAKKPYTLIQGTVASLNGGKAELTRITLLGMDGKTLVDYKPSLPSGNFLLYAHPGSYTIRLEGYHFEPITETVEIDDGVSDPVIKNLSVTLSK